MLKHNLQTDWHFTAGWQTAPESRQEDGSCRFCSRERRPFFRGRSRLERRGGMRSPMKTWQIALASAGHAGPGRVPHRSGHPDSGTAKISVWNARTSVSAGNDQGHAERGPGPGKEQPAATKTPADGAAFRAAIQVGRRGAQRPRRTGRRARPQVELPPQPTNKEPEMFNRPTGKQADRRASPPPPPSRGPDAPGAAGRTAPRSIGATRISAAPGGRRSVRGRQSAVGPRPSVGRQPQVASMAIDCDFPAALPPRAVRRQPAAVGRRPARPPWPHGGGSRPADMSVAVSIRPCATRRGWRCSWGVGDFSGRRDPRRSSGGRPASRGPPDDGLAQRSDRHPSCTFSSATLQPTAGSCRPTGRSTLAR